MLACEHVLTTFIGAMDGQPVGFACLRLIPHLQGDEPYAKLTDIYVDAPFRLQGVARALIAHIEAAARAAGAAGVVIITGFDNARRRRIVQAATPIGRWRWRSASRTNDERETRSGVTFCIVPSSSSTGRGQRQRNRDGSRATR
jgi:GNAT superfamily N-acetyltransferase